MKGISVSEDLILNYNYAVFEPANFEPLMQWENSPAAGSEAPDFPLWTLDETETSLSTLWQQYTYLIVEFGSFT
jgi:hypothetical protein